MIGIIVYLIVLVLEHMANGQSLFFWIWAVFGGVIALLGLISLFVPETPEQKAKRKRENRRKDEIAAMMIGLSDD